MPTEALTRPCQSSKCSQPRGARSLSQANAAGRNSSPSSPHRRPTVAGGSRCTVSLEFEEGQLVLRIADDGHGPGAGGIGVGSESMSRRARELGGRLEISGGSAGTTVVARIPTAAVAAEAP